MTMLYDAFGSPLVGEKLPSGLDVFFQVPIFEGFTIWDTRTAKEAAAAHEIGDFTRSGRMFWGMLSDPRVLDGLEKRGLALRGMRMTVRPGKGQRAKTLARRYAELRARIFRPEVVGEMLDQAIMMGQGVGQAVYRYDETGPDNPATRSTAKKWFVPRVEAWEPTLTTWRPGYWTVGAQPSKGQLVALTQGSQRGDYQMETPIISGSGQWLLFRLSGDQRSWMHGRLRAIWRPWIFRLLALLGWVRYNDVHGLPIRAAKVPMGMRKTKEGQDFYADIKNLGRDAALLLPQSQEGHGGVGVELIEAKAASWQSFESGLGLQGREITICITGGTQNTEATGGNYKGAEEQREIRHEVKAATALAWALMENEQLTEPFATVNGYEIEEAPIVEFDTTPPSDASAEAKAKQEEARALTEAINAWTIARRAGARVPLKSYLAQRGLVLPEDTVYGEPEPTSPNPAPELAAGQSGS